MACCGVGCGSAGLAGRRRGQCGLRQAGRAYLADQPVCARERRIHRSAHADEAARHGILHRGQGGAATGGRGWGWGWGAGRRRPPAPPAAGTAAGTAAGVTCSEFCSAKSETMREKMGMHLGAVKGTRVRVLGGRGGGLAARAECSSCLCRRRRRRGRRRRRRRRRRAQGPGAAPRPSPPSLDGTAGILGHNARPHLNLLTHFKHALLM